MVALLAAVVLSLPGAVAWAQTAPVDEPPATGGPSGAGGNTPGAGRTGGGVGAPEQDSGDGGGTDSTVLLLLGLGVAALVTAVVVTIGRRPRVAAERSTEA